MARVSFFEAFFSGPSAEPLSWAFRAWTFFLMFFRVFFSAGEKSQPQRTTLPNPSAVTFACPPSSANKALAASRPCVRLAAAAPAGASWTQKVSNAFFTDTKNALLFVFNSGSWPCSRVLTCPRTMVTTRVHATPLKVTIFAFCKFSRSSFALSSFLSVESFPSTACAKQSFARVSVLRFASSPVNDNQKLLWIFQYVSLEVSHLSFSTRTFFTVSGVASSTSRASVTACLVLFARANTSAAMLPFAPSPPTGSTKSSSTHMASKTFRSTAKPRTLASRAVLKWSMTLVTLTATKRRLYTTFTSFSKNFSKGSTPSSRAFSPKRAAAIAMEVRVTFDTSKAANCSETNAVTWSKRICLRAPPRSSSPVLPAEVTAAMSSLTRENSFSSASALSAARKGVIAWAHDLWASHHCLPVCFWDLKERSDLEAAASQWSNIRPHSY
mmetsp:Transcript_78461/g.204609  ORF Transcript_78461/g.204609 Transcript_78461/m.204609 type:complete len:441 (+) Transcript_78461:148-1470(+)